MAGFEWKYNLSGGRPLILTFVYQDTETLTKGDIVDLENGVMDLGVTTDTTLAGAFVGAAVPSEEKNSSGVLTPGVCYGTTAVTKGRCIVNPDAVYETTDANARLAGATLDLAGATGAQTVGASSNTDLVVVEGSSATEATRVMIIQDAHYLVSAL